MKTSATVDGESSPADNPASAHAFARRLWPHFLMAGCDLAAWLLAVIMATAALLRLFWFDESYLLVWINSFTQYLYLPAYVCLIWAVLRRHWNLMWLCAAIAALHLTLIAPDFFPAVSPSGDANSPAVNKISTASPPFRLFYANVHFRNNKFDAMYEEALDAEADIIVFVEFTYHWRSTIKNSPLNKEYPYWGTQRRRGGQGVAVWSRLPLVEIDFLPGQPPRTLAIDVVTGAEATRLFILHSPRPVEAAWADYFEYWQSVFEVIDNQSDPMIVVGDFNSTQFSKVYRRLTAERFRGAHEDRGRGFATTWPNEEFHLPPIRIDHVLLTPQLECLRISEGQGRGSDHRPIIADLRLRTP